MPADDTFTNSLRETTKYAEVITVNCVVRVPTSDDKIGQRATPRKREKDEFNLQLHFMTGLTRLSRKKAKKPQRLGDDVWKETTEVR